MDKNRFKHLLDGYLKNELSSDDKELLQRWYNSFDNPAADIPRLTDDQSADRLRNELDARIRTAIFPDRASKFTWFTTKPFRYMAAAVVAPVLGSVVWLTMERINPAPEQKMAAQRPALYQVETGVKQIKRLTLPDSTIVFLNANSALEIPADFGKDRRDVSLTGEAYFDVKRDTLTPFTIAAGGLHVKVLGTSFNVSAYKTLSNVRVAVNTGLVQIAHQQHVLSTLKPGRMLAYNKKTGGFSVNECKAETRSAWRQGLIQLNQASFEEFKQAILNIYGVKLESTIPDDFKTRFNYTIRSTRPLEETLEQFCEVIGKRYRKEDDRVILY